MYVRIVLGNLREGSWDEYQRHYTEKVVPASGQIKGLQGRMLLRNIDDLNQGVSLSRWESTEALWAYERSEARKQLAQNVEQCYQPLAYPNGDYIVRHFEEVAAGNFGQAPKKDGKEEHQYLRTVWGKLRPGCWDDYEDHFRSRLITPTDSVAGLLQRQLLRSTQDPDEGISLSVWQSKKSMLDYETGELRTKLANEVAHLYREQFQARRFQVVFAQ